MIGADIEKFVHDLYEATGHARDMAQLDLDRWRNALVAVAAEEAHAAARHLVEHWDKPTPPTVADFSHYRRDLAIRSHLGAARAAVASAPDHPRI